MSFTNAQVIESARRRVGNQPDNFVGESYVPPEAILAEMRDAIIDASRAFGGSSAAKQKYFVTVPVPTLSTPGAPTNLGGAVGTGTLSAGTYSYRVSATIGDRETVAGPALVLIATDPFGNKTRFGWDAVTGADGYKVYGRTAGSERLLATISSGSTTEWTDLGTVSPGGGMPLTNSTGTGYLQNYPIDTFIGDDVLRITAVYRSDAYVEDGIAGLGFEGLADPLTGRASAPAWIPQGLQGAALDVMVAQARFRHLDRFDYTTFTLDGVRYLCLMPPPETAINVLVEYTSTSGTIASLPDDARSAMEHAACRALWECLINRFGSNSAANPGALSDAQKSDRAAWLEMAQAQRDRYEDRFRSALARAR